MNPASLLEQLITAEEPLALLFSALNDIWRAEGASDIDAFYTERERQTNRLEELLRDTYYEVYDILMERAKSDDRARELAAEDGSVVLLDGLSLREANLLLPQLTEWGFTIADYSFSLSRIPSMTQSFFQDVFGVAGASVTPNNWRGFAFRSIQKGEVPLFLEGPKALVWTTFPDELLHPMRGKGVTPAFALERTADMLYKVLKGLEGERVTITSDHGYIYVPRAAFFWSPARRDQSLLRRLFGAQRGLLFDGKKAADFEPLRQLPGDQAFALFDERGCYIRGRWYWGVGGKQSDVAHGGISLMECLVPVIRLTR